MQLINGSVVRSNRMIGFNQSGHLCCSLAFRRTINRLRPSTSSLVTWDPPRIPIFPSRAKHKHGMCDGTKNHRPAQNGLHGSRERIAHWQGSTIEIFPSHSYCFKLSGNSFNDVIFGGFDIFYG